MCGIAGVLEFDSGSKPSQEGLQRMGRVLIHRGPDEEGFYHSGSVGMAHRRLKIIDLISGQQPMRSPDGQVHIVFNGEIYNYPELKLELEQQNYVFCTQSDTEVLLALYLHYGLNAFTKVNGMFACAFWDARTNQLVLARDRFGKKPLFYYSDSHRFVFASEIKALLAYGEIRRNVNPEALHEYLTYGYTVGEQTIIKNIFRLPPAHLLVVKNQKISSNPYWELEFRPTTESVNETEAIEHLEELLRKAVERRLMSDVPLGAFLSGGLDSSTIVALMAERSERPVQTFTIGFEESEYSELEDARTVAKHLGTNHHEIIVRPSTVDVLPDLVWYLDEPFGDSSALPTYYVCRAARQHVTVAISGDGGDEVFAGYSRYQELHRYQRIARIPTWIQRGFIKPFTKVLPFTCPGWNYLYEMGTLQDGVFPGVLVIYPYIQEKLYNSEFKQQIHQWEPLATVGKILRQVQDLDLVSRYQYLDTLQYLPTDILTKVDRMSMANSLEVRSPLLDYTLVEYVATLPISLKLRDGVSKYILRKVSNRLLPPSVLTKRKQGFAIPRNQWFQGNWQEFAKDILLDPRTLARGYFCKDNLRRLLQHHFAGRRDYSHWIWCLIILEMWFRTFLDVKVDSIANVSVGEYRF